MPGWRSRVFLSGIRLGLTITERDLQEIRTGRYGRVELPSQDEARYWLQQWREAAKPKQETAVRKIFVGRKRPEVRE